MDESLRMIALGRLQHRERSLAEWTEKLRERTASFPNQTNLRQELEARSELAEVRRQIAEQWVEVETGTRLTASDSPFG
jgi:hypothetical protein